MMDPFYLFYLTYFCCFYPELQKRPANSLGHVSPETKNKYKTTFLPVKAVALVMMPPYDARPNRMPYPAKDETVGSQ